MWYIHTLGYYSALPRKEILICASTWLNLEDIMLSEIGQSQKDTYKVPRIVTFLKTESRMVVARLWGEGGMRSYLMAGY